MKKLDYLNIMELANKRKVTPQTVAKEKVFYRKSFDVSRCCNVCKSKISILYKGSKDRRTQCKEIGEGDYKTADIEFDCVCNLIKR